MKIFHLLAQFTPDITYSPIDTNSFLNVLANNIFLGLALVIGLVAFAFLCYMSVCSLGIIISRLIAYSSSSNTYIQNKFQEPIKN